MSEGQDETPRQCFPVMEPETGQFFAWVVGSGRWDVPKLVADAFEEAKAAPFAAGTDLNAKDPSPILVDLAQKKLSDRLRLLAEELVAQWIGDPLDRFMLGLVDDSVASLFVPLFKTALQNLAFSTIAEALLIQQGKRSPPQG
jgi:hypothetical protein